MRSCWLALLAVLSDWAFWSRWEWGGQARKPTRPVIYSCLSGRTSRSPPWWGWKLRGVRFLENPYRIRPEGLHLVWIGRSGMENWDSGPAV